jgi:hypothetical protein
MAPLKKGDLVETEYGVEQLVVSRHRDGTVTVQCRFAVLDGYRVPGFLGCVHRTTPRAGLVPSTAKWRDA